MHQQQHEWGSVLLKSGELRGLCYWVAVGTGPLPMGGNVSFLLETGDLIGAIHSVHGSTRCYHTLEESSTIRCGYRGIR